MTGGAASPRVTFHKSPGHGHFRIDSNNECALTAADLGTELHVWQTIGLRLNPTDAREFANLLIEWSERRVS